MNSAGHTVSRFWRWRRPLASLRLAPQEGGAPTPLEDFEAWCRAHAGSEAQLWIGGRLLHALEIDPTLPLDDRTAPGYARGVFAHYLGAAAADGALAAWRSAGARGMCLLHGLALSGLQDIARRHRVHLRRVRPWWLLQLSRALAAEPALRRAAAARLLVVEGDSLSALTLASGALQSVRPQRLDSASVHALNDWLAQDPGEDADAPDTWAIGQGLAADAAPAGWRPIGRLDAAADEPLAMAAQARQGGLVQAPDFLAPPVPASPRLGWALAVAGALVLATAAWDAWSVQAALSDARARAAGLQALAPEPTSRATPAAPGRTDARDAAPAAGAQALRQAEALLRHPWGALLAAVEAATAPGVQWLALEHRAGRADLRLAGQAADDATPLRLAGRLGELPGWRDVLVARLKPLPGGGVEFTLGAQLPVNGAEVAP